MQTLNITFVNHTQISPKFQPLFVLLNECVELLQKDMLRLKCARDAKSIRQWTAVLNFATSCRQIIQAIENNEFETMEANLHTCLVACKQCALYCYASMVFSNSRMAAQRMLPQLSLFSNEYTR
jgi:hypothetical protein